MLVKRFPRLGFKQIPVRDVLDNPSAAKRLGLTLETVQTKLGELNSKVERTLEAMSIVTPSKVKAEGQKQIPSKPHEFRGLHQAVERALLATGGSPTSSPVEQTPLQTVAPVRPQNSIYTGPLSRR